MQESNSSKQQYCLKWNNHKTNISGVFDRLRTDEKFVDVTLASSDQKNLKCHRVLLSAGSGYLEKILDQNPSDHPTIVLSHIKFNELKHLVEFMYSGEVAVEQDQLSKLLEAANILQIKGLYESSEIPDEKSNSEQSQPLAQDNSEQDISSKIEEAKDSELIFTGSQKRKKRKSTSSSAESILATSGDNKLPKKVKSEDSITPPDSPNVFSPLFGISNAYFLSQQQQSPITTAATNAALNSLNSSNSLNSPNKIGIKDIPSLLSQHPLNPSMIQNLQQLTANPKPDLIQKPSSNPTANENINVPNNANKPIIDLSLLSNTPVRRYKQYTEDTLQLALKEIMNGQSINRSSMKYNIPARTLRDWMKRLNIKSVFTHHSHKDGRSLSADSSDYNSEESQTLPQHETDNSTNVENTIEVTTNAKTNNCMAFPGMKLPLLIPEIPRNGSIEDQNSTEEDEEEIDDDEDGVQEMQKTKTTA